MDYDRIVITMTCLHPKCGNKKRFVCETVADKNRLIDLGWYCPEHKGGNGHSNGK